jgi:antagonist of KipI
VQDLGRWGHQADGVPVAGAMDVYAHRLANTLVDNPDSAATLEITLTGPEMTFDDERVVAVAGASFDLHVDGETVRGDAPFRVRAGSVLRIGGRRSGARAYVAVSGGIDVPLVLGSRSTHAASRMGGFEGRALVAGDNIPLGARRAVGARGAAGAQGARSEAGSPTHSVHPIIRLIPTAHLDRFAPDALEVLQSAPYRVLPQSDRMGFRLEGPALRHTRGADVISDVVPLGTVQVPASGQPILLMADRQTTGGYTAIGTVIQADIGAAAQVAPGETLAFAVCTPGEAIAALIAAERAIEARRVNRR